MTLAARADLARRRRAVRAAGAERARRRTRRSSTSWRSSRSSDFPGYFLVVHDIVDVLPRTAGILCQGRGSAANSAVCYALGITAVDAVTYGLLFERFLSPDRDGPPDIDLDIESDRREEVIQYVYEQLRAATTPPRSPTSSPTGRGRRCATWPRRSATPPASRTPGASRSSAGRGRSTTVRRDDIPERGRGAGQRSCCSFPRHLGIHSGGMVICDRPVVEVVPGRVGPDGRTAPCCSGTRTTAPSTGLVKFDLLGLGMLVGAALLLRPRPSTTAGERRTLHELPPEDAAVYDMLCAGRLGRGVPGRVPGPDGHPAPAAPAQVLRPGRRGRADPARPDPGRLGAPVHPPRARAEEPVTYPHPLLKTGAGANPRACRCSRSS